jgi:flagellar hook-length control protein FliK
VQSAETFGLTPLVGMQQSEPGALARWFAKVTAPAESATLAGQLAGIDQAGHAPGSLLNRLASQTSSQALNGAGAEDAMAATDTDGSGAAATTSFADALANSASEGESLDMALSQSLAKASPTPDTQTGNVPTVTTGQTLATGAQAAMTAVPQAAAGQAVPVTALAVEITRQAMNGKTQFDIRLDPPELGRLNVRLEMDASGQTRTHMVVERSETLDMLTTDARSLERALQQAGLKAEPGSVSFELAQDAADGFSQGQNSPGTDDEAGTSGSDTASGEADPIMGDELASPEAIRQHLHVTGHLDVRI